MWQITETQESDLKFSDNALKGFTVEGGGQTLELRVSGVAKTGEVGDDDSPVVFKSVSPDSDVASTGLAKTWTFAVKAEDLQVGRLAVTVSGESLEFAGASFKPGRDFGQAGVDEAAFRDIAAVVGRELADNWF
jgi:hypothetical protein